MANIPGSHSWSLPTYDSPYDITIYRNGVAVLFTDDCGITFRILEDKYEAALGYLDYALKIKHEYSGNSFEFRVGAIRFIIRNQEIANIVPEFQATITGVRYHPEDRPEVLEIIDIMKSALKMKAFL